MFKYDSEEKVLELVRSFESAAISREDWGHPEHLVVAAYYCSFLDEESAYLRMREGIFNLLERGFGVDLEKEMPYHETLTVFWMGAVRHFLRTNPSEPLPVTLECLIKDLGKNYPLRFYSRELLFSDTARSTFVEPEKPVPWSELRSHS